MSTTTPDAALIALIGGVLFSATDPLRASRTLSDYVSGSTRIVEGLNEELAEAARRLLSGMSQEEIDKTCLAGASWVLGYRAAPPKPGWEVVLSQPDRRLPEGIVRSTGECIIGLIDGASATLSIASPFIDIQAVEILRPSLTGAADRGVQIVIVTQDEKRVPALRSLEAAVRERGRARLRVHNVAPPRPWPHLKLVIRDASVAYVGSANLTGNALLGRNLELGVLIQGDVSPLEAVLQAVGAS